MIEMDAASRTGVDDIRELTDGVRYRPVSARYKVYIIDEVHMLSKNAFNALLKTLEEPPPAVIFVFATTEIHKVPVTVLSRCQRFSLRRVPAEMLAEHYRRVAEAEAVEAEPEALALIARAADGSVRDGLSLLDQAIALAGGRVTEAAVRDMLGVADRGRVFDLFEACCAARRRRHWRSSTGFTRTAPIRSWCCRICSTLSHFLTRLKLAPEAGAGDPIAEGDRERARPLAGKLTMPVLARVWQMLLKGSGRGPGGALADPGRRNGAGAPRLCRRPASAGRAGALIADDAAPGEPGPHPAARGTGAGRRAPHCGRLPAAPLRAPIELAEAAADAAATTPSPPSAVLEPMPQSFDEVMALFDKRREAVLRSHLAANLHLVHFEPGRIEFRPAAGAPRDLANRLGQLLGEWTGDPLADRGFRSRGRADLASAPGPARGANCGTALPLTRWCRRCWRPFPAPRSRRCASALPRPRRQPARRRTGTRPVSTTRPVSKTGP